MRKEYADLFNERTRKLNAKKEKMFLQSQDFKNWKCTTVPVELLEKYRIELLGNKEKAFKFMLSEESAQLEEMRQEVSYFDN